MDYKFIIICTPRFSNRRADVDSQLCLSDVAAIGKAEHWFPDMSMLVMRTNARLGTGGFGEIRIASFCGAKVAVKVAARNGTISWLQSFCIELRILRRLRRPNIVLIHGAIIDAGRIVTSLVLEKFPVFLQ